MTMFWLLVVFRYSEHVFVGANESPARETVSVTRFENLRECRAAKKATDGDVRFLVQTRGSYWTECVKVVVPPTPGDTGQGEGVVK